MTAGTVPAPAARENDLKIGIMRKNRHHDTRFLISEARSSKYTAKQKNRMGDEGWAGLFDLGHRAPRRGVAVSGIGPARPAQHQHLEIVPACHQQDPPVRQSATRDSRRE